LLEQHVLAWSGTAFRHLPRDAAYDVLDFRWAGHGANNRWNQRGEPTLYLAGNIGVAVAEWARHMVDRPAALAPATIERMVYRLDLTLDAVIDLRLPAVCAALSLATAPICFLDIPTARATAHFLRATTPAQGMLVPPVAFLDDLTRWCLVLFLEKLDPRSFIVSVAPEGPLRWR
jgi:RES domain-containing protein